MTYVTDDSGTDLYGGHREEVMMLEVGLTLFTERTRTAAAQTLCSPKNKELYPVEGGQGGHHFFTKKRVGQPCCVSSQERIRSTASSIFSSELAYETRM